MKRLLALLTALLLAPLLSGPVRAGERIGVVLLHGGGAAGNQFDDLKPKVLAAGYGLETPTMCWSGSRRYDKSAEACMADVDKAIAKLKSQGFTRIVVGGHSMGGINAILYAARHRDLAGLIAFAPSSPPTGSNFTAQLARDAARLGKGDEKVNFPGGLNDFVATPNDLLSYLGKDSPLNDQELLPAITAPILWVAGTLDAGQTNALERFRAAPTHPLNSFVTVTADHFETPDVAVGEMVRWLDRLSASFTN